MYQLNFELELSGYYYYSQMTEHFDRRRMRYRQEECWMRDSAAKYRQ